jgi:probable rRNA maturation factor
MEVFLDDPARRMSAAALEWVRGRVVAAAGHLGAAGEVRLRVVGDEEMARAHAQYSRVEGTTDVLTFDLRSEGEGPLDTDILVCFDEAARQATRLGHPVEREILLYGLHGILHCLGEDDHDEVASARMHAREDEVLAAIGVGPTFSVRPVAGAGGPGGVGGGA